MAQESSITLVILSYDRYKAITDPIAAVTEAETRTGVMVATTLGSWIGKKLKFSFVL